MDDEFDDDDLFDSLPASTIQALENKPVILSQRGSRPAPGGSLQGHALPDRHRAPLSTLHQNPSSQRPSFQVPFERAPNNEEEVINLDDYSRTHHEPGVYNSHHGGLGASQNSQRFRQQAQPGPRRELRQPIRRATSMQKPPTQQFKPPSAIGIVQDQNSLQAQIAELEQEKSRLKQLVEAAEAKAQAKAGEAIILRQRIDKTTKEFELAINGLRQTNADATAKHKAELDAIEKARDKVETDRRFLEHDLAVESTRNRSFNKKLPIVPRSNTVPEELRRAALSPRTNRTLPVGDGFDDDVVMVNSPSRNRSEPNSFRAGDHATSFPVSPAKSRRGSKPTTPSHRPEKKRKRVDQSPAKAGEMQLDILPIESSPVQQFTPDSFIVSLEDDLFTLLEPPQDNDFLRSIVDFKLLPQGLRFMEAMSKHCVPKKSNITFADHIWDNWTTSGSTETELALQFCNIICDLWDTSLREKYYVVADPLVAVLRHVVARSRFEVIRSLAARVLPPAMKSINIVAFPIASDSQDGCDVDIGTDIDTELCLDLLLTIAQACQGSNEAATMFWRTMNLHWTLVLLYPAQPLHHSRMMCLLLQTSVLKDSFGPIFRNTDSDSVRNQEDLESYLVDRLSSLLLHDPQPAENEQPFTTTQKLKFRLDILDTLQCACTAPRTGLSLAIHPAVIGRLIQFLYSVLAQLYDTSVTLCDAHHLAVDCVNAAMRLVYLVLTTHAGIIDVREKLSEVDGGAHMHMIVLTRIAFCEGLVLERGIESGVGDAAHTLLDDFLSPVEGEQLLKMFPSLESTGMAVDNERRDTTIDDKTEEDIDIGADHNTPGEAVETVMDLT